MSFGSFLDMGGKVPSNVLKENTDFLCNHFYDERIEIENEGRCTFFQDEIEALKKSIEIIAYREYSPHYFMKWILSNYAPEFLYDLYFLNRYEKAKKVVEDIRYKNEFEFNNSPYKNDTLLKDNFDKVKHDTQQALSYIDEVIKLSNEFRSLINGVFPGLEKEFAIMLKEHNEENAKIEELNLPQPLKINIADKQRTLLFDSLVEGKFINKEDKDSFLYAFGGEKPNKYIPIHWNYKANALFELLEMLTGTVSNENMRRCDSLFENIRNLYRPKVEKATGGREYSQYYTKIQDIKNKIFPTTPTD